MNRTIITEFTLDEVELRAIKNIIAITEGKNTRVELSRYNNMTEIPKEEFITSLDLSKVRGEQLVKTLEALGLVINKRKKINKEDKKAKAVIVFKEEAIEKMIDALVN